MEHPKACHAEEHLNTYHNSFFQRQRVGYKKEKKRLKASPLQSTTGRTTHECNAEMWNIQTTPTNKPRMRSESRGVGWRGMITLRGTKKKKILFAVQKWADNSAVL